MKNFKYITLALITLISLNSCSNDDNETVVADVSGNAQINFDSKVGTADFALNTPFTISGQSIQFERLRYWVSDVKLVNDKNETYYCC